MGAYPNNHDPWMVLLGVYVVLKYRRGPKLLTPTSFVVLQLLQKPVY